MARRFLILQRQTGFTVKINNAPLPTAVEFDKAEYVFPRDYQAADRPEQLLTEWKESGLTAEQVAADIGRGWGMEKVGDHIIRWRFMFHKETTEDEELRGITIFANGKLVQAPFLFHLSGGLGGQHGVEYLTGQVEADYLDRMRKMSLQPSATSQLGAPIR